MKPVVLSLFALICSVPLSAEIISSVSFNPSRMGEYTYLKVTDKANLKGGLNATTLNISSGGTVSMTTDSSSRIYDVPTVTGASGSAINMPNTAFHGNTSNTYSSYKSESTSAPSGLLPNITAKGGTQAYNNDSYIQTLDAVNILKQKVGTLKGGTLEITGNGGSTVGLYDSGNTAGFYLAGNDIPEPTGAHTNTGANLTGCQLAWEKRKTSDSPAKEVYLLALANCGGNTGNSCDSYEAQKCEQPQNSQAQAGVWNNSTCTCSCPSQTVYNAAELECLPKSSSGGGSSGGPSCTWQTVATYTCGTSVSEAVACSGYSQCSVNDYCPGGGIQVEACI